MIFGICSTRSSIGLCYGAGLSGQQEVPASGLPCCCQEYTCMARNNEQKYDELEQQDNAELIQLAARVQHVLDQRTSDVSRRTLEIKAGKLPFGYRAGPDNSIAIDMEQATTVQRIFALRDAGQSLREIATTLNKENRSTPQQSKTWNYNSVQFILKREEKYRGQDGWPAILPEDDIPASEEQSPQEALASSEASTPALDEQHHIEAEIGDDDRRQAEEILDLIFVQGKRRSKRLEDQIARVCHTGLRDDLEKALNVRHTQQVTVMDTIIASMTIAFVSEAAQGWAKKKRNQEVTKQRRRKTEVKEEKARMLDRLAEREQQPDQRLPDYGPDEPRLREMCEQLRADPHMKDKQRKEIVEKTMEHLETDGAREDCEFARAIIRTFTVRSLMCVNTLLTGIRYDCLREVLRERKQELDAAAAAQQRRQQQKNKDST